jgi:hypothetical protein
MQLPDQERSMPAQTAALSASLCAFSAGDIVLPSILPDRNPTPTMLTAELTSQAGL